MFGPSRGIVLGVLVVALSLARTPAAQACQHATQYRLAPLGWVGEELIAAELEVTRTDGADLGESERFIDARVVALDPDRKRRVLRKLARDSRRNQSDLFARALAVATKLADFEPARLVLSEDCGFLNRCVIGQFVPARKAIRLVLGDDESRLLALPSLPADPRDVGNEAEPQEDWLLGRVSVYEGGDHMIVIAHAGIGSNPCDCATPDLCRESWVPEPPKVAADVADSYLYVQMLHHGRTADLIALWDRRSSDAPRTFGGR